MRSRRLIVVAAAVLLASGASRSVAAGLSFWVWNRTTPLTAAETEMLRAHDVRELYWHAGELSDRSGGWVWRKAPLRLPASEIRLIPVVRIDPFGRDAFNPEATRALVAKLRAAIEAHGWSELQIDCDTPDRLLGSYAQALGTIRPLVQRLTVTALAGWSRTPHWQALQQHVDEIFPMFYDLETDPPGIGVNNMPRPLLELTSLREQLRDWDACKIPWRAGLPNFARITVYDRDGRSRGHVRGWKWSDVCFNDALLTKKAVDPATVLLQSSRRTQIARSAVAESESVAARFPDRAALASAFDAANASRANGVVLFRLPDESDGSGWSLVQLLNIKQHTPPRLTLRRQADETLRLTNGSPVDVPPRLAGSEGDRDRGYALEVDAPAAIWREATAGDFWRVAAHAGAESEARPVPVGLATHLTFWFSHMQAGDQLTTGLIQTAPGTDLSRIRYRILNVPGADQWRSIE